MTLVCLPTKMCVNEVHESICLMLGDAGCFPKGNSKNGFQFL